MTLELLIILLALESFYVGYLHFKPLAKADPTEVKYIPNTLDEALLARAKHLTQSIEAQFKGQSGEWKRHQVLAVLLDEFPTMNKRDISLAIEVVL